MTKIAASLPDELVLPARAAPEKGRFASVPAQYVLGPGEPERAVWRRVIVTVLRTTDSLTRPSHARSAAARLIDVRRSQPNSAQRRLNGG
jgi:hypothetical protein